MHNQGDDLASPKNRLGARMPEPRVDQGLFHVQHPTASTSCLMNSRTCAPTCEWPPVSYLHLLLFAYFQRLGSNLHLMEKR
jgi:hypothetical protein